VSRGATAAVLRLLQRGLRSADAVSTTPVGRQLHPEDLQTLLMLLQRLTAESTASTTAGVRFCSVADLSCRCTYICGMDDSSEMVP